jgi:hypothetical protein
MPRINASVKHGLGAEQAQLRVEQLMERIRQDYGDMVSDLTGQWSDRTLQVSFRAYGFRIASDVQIEEEAIAVQSEIPLAALPFKGKIQQTIVGKLEEVLA